MRQVVFAWMVILAFLISCTDEVSKVSEVNEVQMTDLKDHNMKIIPENPTSNDQIKLVVLDDCTYNKLSGISKSGKNIEIQKQFNSQMKWACFQVNDTIPLGKLSEGTYTVNYQLMDVSTQVSNPTTLSFYFNLAVAR